MKLWPAFATLSLVLSCTPDPGSDETSLSGLSVASTPGSESTASTTEVESGGTTSTTSHTTGTETSDSGGFPDGTSTTGPEEPDPFEDGHVLVVGFNDRMVFEFDASLQPVTSWSHPSFDVAEGPSGMVFDHRGYLVVAAFEEFCVFSGPDELETCHPKITAQRTENVIFDIYRNLYTTTSTGGTDEIHKYDESYVHLTTFNLPTGNLTGITCDPDGNLFVASQTPGMSTVYKVDRTNLQVLDSFTVPGNAEGLQYGQDGNLLVALSAGVGIVNVLSSSPSMVVDMTSHPGLLWPVPLTIDQAGNRYTGDFEDGVGAAASDLFVFGPDGSVVASREPSELHGPFGLVVAGTSLPCGAVPAG